MSSETTQAFDHPEARSEASAPLLDRISVRDHVVDVEIGAFQQERGITQRISFDVVVEVRPSSGAETDDVDDILSYDRVTEAIEAEVFAERLNLLETLAERVAVRILQEPQPQRVFVRIQKLDRGASKLGVEIVRSREDGIEAGDAAQAPEPTVIHLGNEALRSEHLGRWIAQMETSGRPVILTVPNDLALSNVEASIAQRRIELLGIEQNAWRLSSSDPRCIVVDSWTELDWGMKNGQLSVWAPSKTVFDSPDNALNGVSDGLALSKWLADQLNAKRHIELNAVNPEIDWGDA